MSSPITVAVSRFDSLTETQVADVRELLAAATEADGVGPMSEDGRLRLSSPADGVTHVIVPGADGSGIAAYAQLDLRDEAAGGHAEIVVAPAVRRLGIGSALTRTLIADSPGGRLTVWAHGDLPSAARLATEFGFARVRELWQMRRSLELPLPEPVVPPGVTVRTFEPGQDEAAWLALNAEAFASHPEQGSWTKPDLRLREAEPWFDPQGFFLAEANGELVGFHWTKTHDAELGEVYVLGVRPGAGGSGLGTMLTLVGLRSLRDRGRRTVLLYVEATNSSALAVYRKLGFTRYAVDVAYSTA